MTLWRISNHVTLDGGGGLRAQGRWHSRGRRIVYCAASPAGALLEVLVHLEVDVEDLPAELQFIEIEMTSASILRIESMPPDARGTGDAWLASGESALLEVPSAIVPATWNILLNPLHPESAQARVRRVIRQGIDPRLLG